MSTALPQPEQMTRTDAYTWRPLAILSIYRMVIVASIVALFFGTRGTPFMATARPMLFLTTAVVYLALSVILYLLVRIRQPGFTIQVYSQISLDIVAIGALILTSGTLGDGMGALLVVAIAGGSILMPVRMAALFAALASLLLLATQVLADLRGETLQIGYSQAGFLGITIFLTALLCSLLAKRARASQALADSRAADVQRREALNGHIVQRLQSGVLAVDGDDRVLLMNAAGWELTGRPTEYRDRQVGTFAPALAEVLAAWRASPATAPDSVVLDSRELSVRIRRLGVDNDDDLLIFLDDQAALRAQVQQGKLAALGRLSASVAHEIRNPLGAMLHAAQLLQESEALSSADRRLIEIILKQGARLNRTVDSVLTLSRRQAAKPVRLQLKDWLDGFIEDFRAQFPQAQPRTLTAAVSPPDLAIEFDPDHLHQVLSNLCRNAVDHGGKNGVCLHISAHNYHGRVWLEVADDGKGIPPEAAQKLFEPFFTTSSSGTGLGLYLCKELCESNRARLELAPSKYGARFRISMNAVTKEVTPA